MCEFFGHCCGCGRFDRKQQYFLKKKKNIETMTSALVALLILLRVCFTDNDTDCPPALEMPINENIC